MNIVFLAPEAICPVNSGYRVVVYNRIKYLKSFGHSIALFCIVDGENDEKQIVDSMSSYCDKICIYNRNVTRVRNTLKSIASPYPVASRTTKALQEDLQQYLKNRPIDIIICELPQMAENLRRIHKYGGKIILSQHNIENAAMRSISDSINNPFKKMIYRLESYRMRTFEKVLYKSELFDAYTFVSSEDLTRFQKTYNYLNKPLKLVPIGAEGHDVQRNSSNDVVIVGKMSYLPNIEGVLWFVNNVWPSVLKKKKNAHLYIVGKDPDERIMALENNSISVTGTVESVEPYYLKAGVAVIPVFSGGGVKTKLIEAISYRVPVVSTQNGLLGTMFKDKIHVLVADDPESMVSCIIDSMNDSSEINDRVNSAYELFVNEYTWRGVVKEFEEFLLTIKI